MKKELLTIEFRYYDVPKNEHDSGYKSKTITLGVFDNLEDAIIEGNKAMEVFEKHFKLNPNWNRKERFSKNGGCFGTEKRLISPLAYLQCSFDFYAKITTLNFDDIESTILAAIESTAKYREYEKSQQD